MGRSAGIDHDMPDIDTLLSKEGLQVEWKKNVADVGDVVRTLSAFANDFSQAGRGWVICGIEEQRDPHGFPKPHKIGLKIDRYQELRHKVIDWCHRYVRPAISPKIHEYEVTGHPDRRLLVFEIAASEQSHWVDSSKDGTSMWYRIDSHTRRAPHDVITALMRAKGESPPFLTEACPGATVADLDQNLINKLLAPFELPRPIDDYLAPGVKIDARTPPLVVTDNSSESGVPTRLAVLLGCREPDRFLLQANAVLAVYDGDTKSSGHSQRFDLGGPLTSLIKDVLNKLRPHIGYDVDKAALVTDGRQNQPRYARRAIEEAVVNAFVHRDYAADDPVRIDVFTDRIEIWSPGGLARSIDGTHLAEGKVVPSWRNTELISVMLQHGLVQELGQGLTTIIEKSLEVTRKRPEFRNENGWFGVVLPAFRPLISASHGSHPVTATETGRAGVLFVSIGGQSIRATAEKSFGTLNLSPDDVLVDFFDTNYIESPSPQWREQARRIRDEIARWVEDPAYDTFHLFYRGPVVMAPLIGAMIVPVKPLVLYHYENGKYAPALTLERRFLHEAS
ncbi:MAG: hypothetical protein Tsb0020_25110 [Haliangiales bacterium]